MSLTLISCFPAAHKKAHLTSSWHKDSQFVGDCTLLYGRGMIGKPRVLFFWTVALCQYSAGLPLQNRASWKPQSCCCE